jgi:type IV pilus assembly protein PilX
MQSMKHQSGAVLIVSLIMLLILTLLAFSGGQTVVMQEKMTFTVQDSQVAFQSAERGIKQAQAYIDANILDLDDFSDDGTTTAGLYNQGKAPTDFFTASTWAAGISRETTATVNVDVAKARYFIEEIGLSSGLEAGGDVSDIGGYGQNGGVSDNNVFKIVSRGQGRSTSTQRIIVSFYAKSL